MRLRTTLALALALAAQATMVMDDAAFVEGNCVADVGYPLYSSVMQCEMAHTAGCHLMNYTSALGACAFAMPDSGGAHDVDDCACYPSDTSVVAGCVAYFASLDDGDDAHSGHSGHSGHSHRTLRGERLLMGDDGCAVAGARSTPAAVWRASLLLSAAVGALLPAM